MTNRNGVLLRWQTEEATVRARLAAPGVTSPEDLKASSGIEFLQRIFNGELPSPPIGATLGFVPIAAEPGRVVFQGAPDKRHYNPLGGVHGGYFCTLLDSALGCAIHSTLPEGRWIHNVGAQSKPYPLIARRSGPRAGRGQDDSCRQSRRHRGGHHHRRRRKTVRACDHDVSHFPAPVESQTREAMGPVTAWYQKKVKHKGRRKR